MTGLEWLGARRLPQPEPSICWACASPFPGCIPLMTVSLHGDKATVSAPSLPSALLRLGLGNSCTEPLRTHPEKVCYCSTSLSRLGRFGVGKNTRFRGEHHVKSKPRSTAQLLAHHPSLLLATPCARHSADADANTNIWPALKKPVLQWAGHTPGTAMVPS